MYILTLSQWLSIDGRAVKSAITIFSITCNILHTFVKFTLNVSCFLTLWYQVLNVFNFLYRIYFLDNRIRRDCKQWRKINKFEWLFAKLKLVFFMWQIELKNVQEKKTSSFSTYHIQYRLTICSHWSRSWVHWCYVSACQYLQKRYQIVFKTYIPIQWFNATCWTGSWSYNLKLYKLYSPMQRHFHLKT